MTMLESIGHRLAGLEDLSVEGCEQAFACTLSQDEVKPGKYRGYPAEPNIASIDVRIGDAGGVIVVNFTEEAQAALVEAFDLLGPPIDVHVVSPPMAPAEPPEWSRKWSAAHIIGGAEIWFGFEEIGGTTRLLYASRSFPA